MFKVLKFTDQFDWCRFLKEQLVIILVSYQPVNLVKKTIVHQLNVHPVSGAKNMLNTPPCRGVRPLQLEMSWVWYWIGNCIQWWCSSSRPQGSMSHLFVALTLRSTLTWSGSIRYGFIYEFCLKIIIIR